MTWGRCNFLIVHISGDVSPPAKLHVSTFRVSVYVLPDTRTLETRTLEEGNLIGWEPEGESKYGGYNFTSVNNKKLLTSRRRL